jgi:glycogen operon protein
VLRRRSFFTGRDGGGRKDLMWIRTDGEEMTDEDWADPENRVLGMLIPGRATDERDERGRRIRGDTVLLVLNGGTRSRKMTLPRLEGGGLWHEILHTAHPGQTRVIRRDAFNLVAHSLVLLRFEGAERSSAPSGGR